MLDTLASPFNKLSSDYLRLKYFENSGDLILAEDYIVGEREEYKKGENRIVIQTVPSKAKHIPLRKTLKKFLEFPGVLSTILT